MEEKKVREKVVSWLKGYRKVQMPLFLSTWATITERKGQIIIHNDEPSSSIIKRSENSNYMLNKERGSLITNIKQHTVYMNSIPDTRLYKYFINPQTVTLKNVLYVSKIDGEIKAPFSYQKLQKDEYHLEETDTKKKDYISLSEGQVKTFKRVFQYQLNNTKSEETVVIPLIRNKETGTTFCNDCGKRRLLFFDYKIRAVTLGQSNFIAYPAKNTCKYHFNKTQKESFISAENMNWADFVNEYKYKLGFNIEDIKSDFAKNNLKKCVNTIPSEKIFNEPNPTNKQCVGVKRDGSLCNMYLDRRENVTLWFPSSSKKPVSVKHICRKCSKTDNQDRRIKSEDNHSYQTSIIKGKINSLNSDHGIPHEQSLSIVLNVLNNGKGPLKPDTTPLTKQQERRLITLSMYNHDSISIDRVKFDEKGGSVPYNDPNQRLFGNMMFDERISYIKLLEESMSRDHTKLLPMAISRYRWQDSSRHLGMGLNQIVQIVEKNSNRCLITNLNDNEAHLSINRLLEDMECSVENFILLETNLTFAKASTPIFRNRKNFMAYFKIDSKAKITNDIIIKYIKLFLSEYINDIVKKFKTDNCNGVFNNGLLNKSRESCTSQQTNADSNHYDQQVITDSNELSSLSNSKEHITCKKCTFLNHPDVIWCETCGDKLYESTKANKSQKLITFYYHKI
ncbi:hypothetical protein BJ944DRAFT_233322 [Cunninghamella echinulata]|nr:hypothetical protein BJ944DRAFT_233322 [Cunninghamella echinulata]